jgi:hypothetical protein
MDPIYTLSAEQYADFLDTLTKLKFTSTLILIAANDPTLHYSNTMTVKINHSNGVFETVSPYGYAEQYDPNEDSLDAWDYGSCDDAKWELLLKSVVPEEIYNPEPKDPYGTFSYNEALSSATASGSNIRTSGFVNSTGLDYSRYSGEPLSWYSVEAILMRAKDECTIEYEHTRLYIDKEEYVYCIEFMGKSEKECIYINRSLATILAVKIPTTDAGTENGGRLCHPGTDQTIAGISDMQGIGIIRHRRDGTGSAAVNPRQRQNPAFPPLSCGTGSISFCQNHQSGRSDSRQVRLTGTGTVLSGSGGGTCPDRYIASGSGCGVGSPGRPAGTRRRFL